jgi:microcystin-dependent protein
MGADIQKGTIYAEGGVGGAGTVNADNLNAHVDEARIKASFISGKTLRDPGSLSDSIVVEAGGVLYRETFQQVIDLIGQAIRIPIGVIMDFAGTSPPGGWLLCFGQLVNRTTYSDLFDVIGTTYSAGDGVTTFGIPDLRGRVAAGKDNMGGTAANRLQTAWGVDGATLGAGGGTQSHQLTVAQLAAHSHPPLSGQTAFLTNGAGGAGFTISGTWGSTNPTGTTGGDQAHPNVQPTVVVNKIIRCQ